MEPLRWTTAGDPTQIRDIVAQQLSSLGYTVEVDPSGWSGSAEVGSKAVRAVLGGFARRMLVTFSVEQGFSEGQIVASVVPNATGWSGGALGASKAKKEMASIGDAVSVALASAGLMATLA